MANVPKAKKFMSKDNASGGRGVGGMQGDRQSGWHGETSRSEESRGSLLWAWPTAARLFWLSIGELLLLLLPPLARLYALLYALLSALLPAVSCLAVCAPCSTLGHLLCAFWKYNKDSTGHIMHFACLHKYLHNTKRGDTPLRPLHSQPSRQSSVTNCQK